jgi:hypothetical protein
LVTWRQLLRRWRRSTRAKTARWVVVVWWYDVVE